MIPVLLLTACLPTINDTTIVEVAARNVIEARGECDAGPVCVDVEDAMLSGVAYAWQCGGTGTSDSPGDPDDCISRVEDAYALGDATGDQVCVDCTDVDDTGPSEANPWTYLILGVCEFTDTAALNEAAR